MAIKRWLIKDGDKEIQEKLIRELNISSVLAKLLVNRGYHDVDEARDFLAPQLENLSSPLVLEHMQESIERIFFHLEQGNKIVVYGDYDVDGICASVILYQGLEELGARVDYYIPDRMEEGYGVNEGALRKIYDQGAKLVVTVDCGISSAKEVAAAKSWGLEVIVTDHHQLPEETPQCLIINPVLESNRQAPWANLCGAGVALTLVHGLLKHRYPDQGVRALLGDYLDVAALATVADIVELKGDNRIIVKYGLEVMSTGNRPGIKALCEVSGAKLDSLTTSNLGFGLAPRINACGRIGDPKLGVKLLLSNDDDESRRIAEILNQENGNRQEIENQIINEAIDMVESQKFDREKGLIVVGEGWHPGVIGIVASRLVERYYTPTIVLAKQEDGSCKGSGRSIAGFHLQQALMECQELLGAFGGHSQAAGLSLPHENLPAFRKQFAEIIARETDSESFTPILKIDEEVELGQLTFPLLEEILKIQPTGQGNPEPVLVCRAQTSEDTRLIGGKQDHLRIKLRGPAGEIAGIAFKMADLEPVVRDGSIDVAFNLQKNVWNGRTSLQMMIKDLKSFKIPDSCSFIDRLFFYGHDYLVDDQYRGIEDSQCFYTKVVGVSFNNRQEFIASLVIGHEVELKRDLGNIYDPNAIAVIADGEQIGFLKKELARSLAPNLDKGIPYLAQVTQVTGGQENQSLGVNLLVRKVDQHGQQQVEQRKEVRSQLQKLTDGALREAIQREVIGEYSYRPKQQEALDHLAVGKNVLAILGTGRGKSAIFQSYGAYLALAKEQVTVIVYPLRSLVNDQYQSLQKKLSPLGLVVAKGTGALEGQERINFFHQMAQGQIDVILTTPEFLFHHRQSFGQLGNRLGLVVVDEAHHMASRRIGYKQLPMAIKALGSTQVLAVTATADDGVGETIQQELSIDQVVIDGHIRKNLQIVDRRQYSDKLSYIYNLALKQEKTVVYVNSRKQAYKIAFDIREKLPMELKDRICYYHGGLASNDRLHVENLFRENSLSLIVTTNAFGEGIDIPDIRNVVLYHLSFSKKEYNQLAGRAGRNNKTADIHLLYGKKDSELNELLLDGTAPNREQLGKFYVLLKRSSNDGKIAMSNGQLAELGQSQQIKGLTEQSVSHWLGIFEELGLITREGNGTARTITIEENGKVNLDNSIRYVEGLAEREDYEEFKGMAYLPEAEPLLALMNRPIFPQKWLDKLLNEKDR